MKLLTDSPDIPNELLDKIEHGKVVFFIGAGLSYELDLGDFNWLVNEIRKETATDKHLPEGIPEAEVKGEEKQEYTNPDLFLNYLASHLGEDGHQKVKKAAINVLGPKKEQEGQCKSHEAILQLATRYNCSIVTTNLDHGFLYARDNLNLKDITIAKAPTLPPATKDFLPTLVYLHGIIDKAKDPNGNCLILTSKDFGFAYLKYGWATRFLTTLFENFTILFIGYSINDPVIRYLTDIFSYEKSLDAYAFVGYSNTEECSQLKKTWEFKGVKPIAYDNNNGHDNLHQAIREFPKKLNAQGRKSYITTYAKLDPDKLDDIFHDQVLWAMGNLDNEITQFFIDQHPDIRWIKYLDKAGLLTSKSTCISRGSLSFNHNAAMSCPQNDLNGCARSLLPWILRHLEDQELLDYVLKQGCHLKSDFASEIKKSLTKLNGPDGIYRVWDILVNRKELLPQLANCNIYEENKTTEQWLNLLTPYLDIRVVPPFYRDNRSNEVKNIRHFADFEIIFPRVFGHSLIDILKHLEPLIEDKHLLNGIAFDLTTLLKRVYDIKLLYADILSHYDRSSVNAHDQNNYHPIWTCLIDLLREAFLYLKDNELKRAILLVEYWKTIDYPIFIRLVLFAMSHHLFSNEDVLEYLIEKECKVLWDIDYQCERYELLEAMKNRFTHDQWKHLIDTLISTASSSEIKHDEYLYWLLQDISELGIEVTFPKICDEYVKEYSTIKREEWQKKFSTYMTGGWVGENSDYTGQKLMSISTDQLYNVLTDTNVPPRLLSERLSAFKSELKDNAESVCKLFDFLFEHKKWGDKQLWNTCFNYTRDNLLWDQYAERMHNMPDMLIKECLYDFSGWLRDTTKNILPDQEKTLWSLIDRAIGITLGEKHNITINDSENDSDPLHRAINSSVGHLMETIIYRIYARKPKVGDTMPGEIKARIEQLLVQNGKPNILAGVILSWHLYHLYLIDPKWAKTMIITHMHFDENDKYISRAYWIGYFYNLTYSVDLIQQLKEPLLSAIKNKTFFDNKSSNNRGFKQKLIEFYILALLCCPEIFNNCSPQKELAKFNNEELETVVFTLYKFLDASKLPNEIWDKQLKEWIHKHFPQTETARSEYVSLYFIKLLLLLDKEFHDAFVFLTPYLSKMKNQAFQVLHLLKNSEKLNSDPETCLKILRIVIDGAGHNTGLNEILKKIQTAHPDLAKTELFLDLGKIANS